MRASNPSEDVGVDHAGGELRPGTLREELSALLRAPFPSEQGCFRQGLVGGVYVSSEAGSASELVNLAVQFFGRVPLAPGSPVEDQARTMELNLCLRLLRHRRSEMRVAACQKLARLACGGARDALLTVARGDAVEEVREAAAGALEYLALEALPTGGMADLELFLVGRSPFGDTELGRARTDYRGCALFADVPKTTCTLQLGESESPSLNSDENPSCLLPLPQRLAFDHVRSARSSIGDLSLELSPRRHEGDACFDAVLRFSGLDAADNNPLRLPFRPVARHGQHLYQPSFNLADQALVTFDRLPVGEYDLLWHVQPAPAEHDSRLLAKSACVASQGHLNLAPDLQIVVHPADRRLLATVEPDHVGRVVLTVAADAEELQGARIRYRLLDETGEMLLNTVAGTGVARGVRYLRQRFAPESALSLSLEIAA